MAHQVKPKFKNATWRLWWTPLLLFLLIKLTMAWRCVLRSVTKLKRINSAINCWGRTITGRNFQLEVPINLPPSDCVAWKHLTAAKCSGSNVYHGVYPEKGRLPQGAGEEGIPYLLEIYYKTNQHKAQKFNQDNICPSTVSTVTPSRNAIIRLFSEK